MDDEENESTAVISSKIDVPDTQVQYTKYHRQILDSSHGSQNIALASSTSRAEPDRDDLESHQTHSSFQASNFYSYSRGE